MLYFFPSELRCDLVEQKPDGVYRALGGLTYVNCEWSHDIVLAPSHT